MLELTQSTLTRQELLRIWLYRRGITKTQIAKAIGVTIMAVTHWFESERIPTRRHSQLVDLGIPPELLPVAEDLPRGPRSREIFPGRTES